MDDTCVCGKSYADFRTDLDFGEVRRMMFVADLDPSRWRQKRRRSVLGFWREIKRQRWASHLAECQWWAIQAEGAAE